MMLRIQSFIERNLADPLLSPGMIAAAHHISVRGLHKMYEAEEQTIAASIRRQRLEGSRQDLLDPGLRDRPVSAVGARWGFQDPAAFSRAFRAAYGVPPAEYRAMRSGGVAGLRTRQDDRGFAALGARGPVVVARRSARHRPAVQASRPHRPRPVRQQERVPHEAVVVGHPCLARCHGGWSPVFGAPRWRASAFSVRHGC
jgi:AraC-like DNA-binding protein